MKLVDEVDAFFRKCSLSRARSSAVLLRGFEEPDLALELGVVRPFETRFPR